MFFLTYLRRELRHRMRQAMMIAGGLALGVGLVIAVIALSSGVRSAQGKVLGALYGVGTDITVTMPTTAASGSAGYGQITPKPYEQHSDTLSSPTLGTLEASSVTAISRLPSVAAVAGGLVLTEIQSTIPAENAPPASFETPVQTSVVGVDLNHGGLGPFSVAQLVSGKMFTTSQAEADVAVVDGGYATTHHLTIGSSVTITGKPFEVIGIVRQNQSSNPPQIYIPLARAQTLSNLAGMVNIVYVQAASAANVDTVTNEIAKLMPAATVKNSASLAKGVAGSLATTAKLATSLGTWLAVLALLAAFAIACLLTMATVERRGREFGTLKALGWPSSRISGQVMGELLITGFVGAALGIVLGLGGARLAATAAPQLSATVQQTNIGSGSFGGDLSAGGGIFHGTVGGAVQTIANPSATHTVEVPFDAPITLHTIVLAVVLAIAGALIAGVLGGWRITRLRPAAALSRVE